jgi:hypothetical protein
MAGSNKPALPVAIVVAGNLTMEGHYEHYADTLIAVLERGGTVARPFKDEEAALAYLSEQALVGAWKGVLLFVSGSMLSCADEIAAGNEDVYTVVLTGRYMPEGRALDTWEKGRAVLIDKGSMRPGAITSEIMPR